MIAAIYARFSSDYQREESIEAQIKACTDYAAKNGHQIGPIYADRAASGKNDRRPEFQRMLRDAENGAFELLLVHKYNRFARRMSDHVRYEDRLNDQGIELVAVAEDYGHGKEAVIMKALMRSMSEYFLLDLADEVRKGLKVDAEKGLHNGGFAPFGYDVKERRYVINEFEAAFVRKIFDAALAGSGFGAVIREMRDCGVVGKRGKPIGYNQIYDILKNEKYTGVYIYTPVQAKGKAAQRAKNSPGAIRVEGAIPQIIEREKFEEVQKIMATRKHSGRHAEYLCSRLVYCAECGAPMHAIMTKQGRYGYYYCSKKCGAPNVRMDDVDAAAIAYLREILSSENREKIAAALKEYEKSAAYREQDFYSNVKAQISERRAQYDAIMSNLSSATLPAPVVADLGRKMESLLAEIEALKQMKPEQDLAASHVEGWLDAIAAAPDAQAVRLLIEKIEVKERIEFSIHSTLNSILGINGCGTPLPGIPKILLCFLKKSIDKH